MGSNKLDIFDPGIIIAFIFGFISDFLFLFMIALAVPGVGLAIAAFILLAHYLSGLIVGGFFWHKTRGWFAKLLLGAGIALPLPTLALGIILGIVFSNKLLAFLGEQAAIILLTGGAGEAIEGAALVGEGAEAVGTAAKIGEGVGAATDVAETAQGVGEAAKEVEEVEDGADKLKKAKDRLDKMNQDQDKDEDSQNAQQPDIKPEALGQERELLGREGQLERDLLEETPQTNRKVQDISSHPNFQRSQEDAGQEEDRDLAA